MNQPLTSFQFQVEWGGSRLGFSEVSGLAVSTSVIEYREGNSRSPAPLRIPGRLHYHDLVLRRGLILQDNEFFEWMHTVLMRQPDRRDLTIGLLNEQHEPVYRWRVRDAWPRGWQGPILDAARSAVAIESLTIAHEGVDADVV